MQETQVWSLVQEDPTCLGATKPVYYTYWVCVLEAWKPKLLKPKHPRARALQQEKPLQWEAFTLQLQSNPSSQQLGKSPPSNEDSAQPKINKITKKREIKSWISCRYKNEHLLKFFILLINLWGNQADIRVGLKENSKNRQIYRSRVLK